jgi:hypothetical protein
MAYWQRFETLLGAHVPRVRQRHDMVDLDLIRLGLAELDARTAVRIVEDPSLYDAATGALVHVPQLASQHVVAGVTTVMPAAAVVTSDQEGLNTQPCPGEHDRSYPVCIESDRQGSSQLNLSACHGCTLISETSCESGNRLLDRQLVLGGTDVPGLVEAVLPEVRRTLTVHN